jgi:hypothetical protein
LLGATSGSGNGLERWCTSRPISLRSHTISIVRRTQLVIEARKADSQAKMRRWTPLPADLSELLDKKPLFISMYETFVYLSVI